MQIAIERICKKWLCSSVWTTHTYCKKNQRISKMKKLQHESQKHLTWLHYTTAYLQRPTVGRYKSVQRPTVGRYIHIASDLTRGYKWRRYKL